MTSDKRRSVASDFHPEVLSLFDKYVHHVIDRRAFLDGAARFAVAGLTAQGLLEALSPSFAEAQQIAPDDGRLDAQFVAFAPGTRGYLVRKKDGPKKLPAVLVAHE